ncbi:MAG: putative glycosyltransferase EpsF [Candidatus Hinthialibacteria bacterium OLB16]|nr:MAG: putative glycosyltransferase EpsF [Candidatus Hinthialibacteria bacterium OLB16]
MPNVLFVIPSLDVSGRGIQLSLLSRLLAKTVFKPHILCLGEEGQFAAQTRDAGVIVEAAGCDEASSLKSCYQVRKFCRKHEIDLVQTYLSGRELGSVRGARSAGITRIITSRREIPEEHSPVLRARKAANRKTDFIIANSQAAKDFCCSQEQWPSELVDVIPNGFPADRIPGNPALFSKKTRRYLQSFNLQPDEKVLVCIASFHEVKNHLVLLEAFRKLLFEKPLIRLILLGEGPLLAEVERYAGERSLGRAVAAWEIVWIAWEFCRNAMRWCSPRGGKVSRIRSLRHKPWASRSQPAVVGGFLKLSHPARPAGYSIQTTPMKWPRPFGMPCTTLRRPTRVLSAPRSRSGVSLQPKRWSKAMSTPLTRC